jgi:hypothetical protein
MAGFTVVQLGPVKGQRYKDEASGLPSTAMAAAAPFSLITLYHKLNPVGLRPPLL